jgi:small subunit ribosomal protein S16
MGRSKRPFYRLVAMDARTRRDGAEIERLGWYDPLETSGQKFSLNEDRIYYWLGTGAQPTDTVKNLFSQSGISLKWHLKRTGKSAEEIEAAVREWDAGQIMRRRRLEALEAQRRQVEKPEAEEKAEAKAQAKEEPEAEEKAEAKAEAKEKPEVKEKAEAKAEAKEKPEVKETAEPKAEAKEKPEVEKKAEAKAKAKAKEKPAAKTEAKSKAAAKTKKPATKSSGSARATKGAGKKKPAAKE